MRWLIGAFLVLAILASLQIYSPLGKEENVLPLSTPIANVLGTTSGKTEFLVIGDSGNGSIYQKQLAAEMEKTNATFFLHVGDIAYQRGRADELKKNFADVYANLLKKQKAYPAPGNHDYLTNNLSPYLAYFNPPKQALNSSDQGRYYSFDAGNIHFVSLDTNNPLNEISDTRHDDMGDWLEKDLVEDRDRDRERDSGKHWVVVYFHHPPYSSGKEHGSDLRVQQKLVPIFEKYKVDLVFAGHEHNYERTCPLQDGKCVNGQGILYIVTGGGGAGLYGFGEPQYFSVVRSINYEFVDVTVDGCKLDAKVIGLNSKEIDAFSLNKCS